MSDDVMVESVAQSGLTYDRILSFGAKHLIERFEIRPLKQYSNLMDLHA